MSGATKGAVTGFSSAFGALLGGLLGAEIAETRVTYMRGNVRRIDLERARTTGAVSGGMFGALAAGALAGSSSVGDPEPKQIQPGVSGLPLRFP